MKIVKIYRISCFTRGFSASVGISIKLLKFHKIGGVKCHSALEKQINMELISEEETIN